MVILPYLNDAICRCVVSIYLTKTECERAVGCWSFVALAGWSRQTAVAEQ